MAQIDGSRAGVRVQLKRRILWEPQRHASRTRVHVPCPSRIAIGLNVSASSVCLQGSAKISKLQPARPSPPDRTLRCLLEGEVAAAGLSVKAARHTSGSNRAASSTREDAAFYVVDIDAARS